MFTLFSFLTTNTRLSGNKVLNLESVSNFNLHINAKAHTPIQDGA